MFLIVLGCLNMRPEPLTLRFEIDDDKEKVVESAISKVECKDETSLLLPFEVYFKDNVSLGVNAGGPMKVNMDTLSHDRNYFRKINRR